MKALQALLFSLILSAALDCAAQEQREIPDGAQSAEISARVQEDVTRLLSELVGDGRARAFVSVEGELELKSKTDSTFPEEGNLSLPGYASLNILEKTGLYLKEQKQETQRTTEFRINKMTVSLIFDSSIPEARVNAIRLMISGLLRLSEARGDSITSARADMLPWWRSALYSAGGGRILLAAGAAAFIFAALLIIAYLLAARLLAVLADRARFSAPVGPAAGPGPRQSREEETGEGGDILDLEARPASGCVMVGNGSSFDLLDTLPPGSAAELLGEVPEEDAAIIIANLADRKPHLSSKILLAFTPGKRQAIAAGMLNLREVEPERIFEIEDELRLKLEKTLKGADKLGRLLSLVNEAERSEIMDGLSRADPKGSEEMRRRMITFDSVCALDEKNLRPLLAAVPYADWGTALWGASEAVSGNILRLLPEHARLIVKEMAATRPEDEKVLGARAKIISTAMDLAAKGRIEIAREAA